MNFKLQPISKRDVATAIRKLKAKRSSGFDGVSQELLKQISSVVSFPLKNIINASITSGIFPSCWKHAKIIPVHKKGDATLLANYRPISCLPSSSKVLESVVLKQLTEFFEVHRLLPRGQHGFRKGHSTSSAVASMVTQWAKNHEMGMHTGVLLWDLSAAFDTIDVETLCRKLSLFGVQRHSVDWFRSFLNERCQQVQVGNGLSDAAETSIGCPQGSLLSPLLFLIYVSDMQLWMDSADIHSYADDTSTSVSSKCETEVIRKLEYDAENFLRFTASNNPTANPDKTGFLFIRTTRSTLRASVRVGGTTVEETDHHRILGIIVNNELSWNDHVYGNGALLQSVNQRVGSLKRVSGHVPRAYLGQIANAIVSSKIRYGSEIYCPVRMSGSDPLTAAHNDLQKALNRAMRIVANCRLRDRISIPKLVESTGMRTVNQMSAESKISILWRGVNEPGSPLADIQDGEMLPTASRSSSRGDLKLRSRTAVGQRNFPEPAIRLWNRTKPSLRLPAKKSVLKREIREFVNTLPL